VYEMYPWDQPGAVVAAHRERRADSRRRALTPAAEQAAEALQVALDRRDNGGDSPAASGQ
jgi:hypothetical protein